MAAIQKRVLVVDDALDIARLLRSALGAADPDLSIQVFPSAEEAIFASAREPVHLLISDLRLPGISGAELVKRIRAANPNVRVIMITGLNEEQINRHMKGVSVDALFHKPFEVSDFVAAAQRYLQEAAEGDTSAGQRREQLEAVETRLSRLQASLAAEALWLFDVGGKCLAVAGDAPEDGMMLTSVWSGADELDALLGSTPARRSLTLWGGGFVVLLAADAGYTLALRFPAAASHIRLALAAEESLAALPGMAECLAQPVVRVDTPAAVVVDTQAEPEVVVQEAVPTIEVQPEPPADNEPASPEDDLALAGLEQLLEGAVPTEIDDVNAFWESLAESGEEQPPDQTLSYDEARRMGLTGDEGGD